MTSPLITVHAVGPVTVVRFAVRHIREFGQAQSLGEQLASLVEDHGCRRVVVNFAALEVVSELVISRLLFLRMKLGTVNGRLVLCGMQPVVQQYFEAFRLDRFFSIFPNEESALREELAGGE